MHRLGFNVKGVSSDSQSDIPAGEANSGSDIPELIERLRHQQAVIPRSVFSHFVGSDSDEFNDFSAQQFQLFDEGSRQLQAAFSHKILRHMDNSAGIEHFPERQMDMCRLGIGLYGVEPYCRIENSELRMENYDYQASNASSATTALSSGVQGNHNSQSSILNSQFSTLNSQSSILNSQLTTVSTLKTTILQLRQVKAGDSIGYSRRTVLERDSLIAAIPIGYADGLNRHLGNRHGYCLVNGQRADYVGNICMDVAMIDVTGIPCSEGDSVEIFGVHLPVTVLSDLIDTIPYEVLTGVSNRVKRVYFQS